MTAKMEKLHYLVIKSMMEIRNGPSTSKWSRNQRLASTAPSISSIKLMVKDTLIQLQTSRKSSFSLNTLDISNLVNLFVV